MSHVTTMCRFPECSNRAASKQRGLCRSHGVQLWRAGGDASQLKPLRVRNQRVSDDGQTYRCRLCDEWKPASDFPLDRARGRGRQCYGCHAAYMREWTQKNPGSVRASILRRRGLTPDSYDALLEEQGRRCAICRTDKTKSGRAFAVDHDQVTGRVCGLLCESCNRGLGYFGEDVGRLEAAIEYLRRTAKTSLVADLEGATA